MPCATVLGGPPGRADVSRVAMLLVNFLLVRLLIGQVILKVNSLQCNPVAADVRLRVHGSLLTDPQYVPASTM